MTMLSHSSAEVTILWVIAEALVKLIGEAIAVMEANKISGYGLIKPAFPLSPIEMIL